MKYVYLLKYNLYSNRILKRSDTVLDYLGLDNANVITYITDCTLWNPNDGISAYVKTPINTDFTLREPDYCLAVDDNGNIESRWFVMENKRLRRGQYECTLRRDVLAESWEALQESTCWIDRALLKESDYRIFNNENIRVSQIKTSETLLKDRTGCPWIVCYGSGVSSDLTGTIDTATTAHMSTQLNKEQFEAANTFKFLPNDVNSCNASVMWKFSSAIASVFTRGQVDLFDNDIDLSTSSSLPGISSSRRVVARTDSGIYITNRSLINKDDLYASVRNKIGTNTYKLYSDYVNAFENNNKYIYSEADGKYYTIRCQHQSGFIPDLFNVDSGSALEILMKSYVDNNISNTSQTTFDYNNFIIGVEWEYIITSLEPATLNATTYRFPVDKYKPSDAPYFAWCMPYGNIKAKFLSTDTAITTSAETNLRVATSLARLTSQNLVYSIEILPYCPLPEKYFSTDGNDFCLDAQGDYNLTGTGTMTHTEGGETIVEGFIYCLPRTSFSTTITCNITPNNRKVESITNLWRLTSPSNSASFEFSVEKNLGLTGFQVSCTYIPSVPYIAIRPLWKGANGSGRFPDNRVLILNDDFSITRLNDNWINYQEQNKNWNQLFNREIRQMDTLRKYQRVSEGIQAFTGAVGGGVIGGKAFGAGAGVALGVVSGVAGATDVFLQEKQYQLNKTYKQDVHNLELGNIQAQPVTLAKTTGINIDNRYFPVLEKYTCQSGELFAVTNYLINNSFNCGFIDTLGTYVNNNWVCYGTQARGFISGHIIKIDINEDPHYFDELNNELTQGVYMR